MLSKTGNVRGHLGTAETPLQSSDSRLPQPAKPSGRNSPLKFFASSATKPDASRTQKDWQASFLNNLRSNRPVRPNGSRPIPERERPRSFTPAQDLPLRTSSAMSRRIREPESLNPSMPDRCSSAMSQRPFDTEALPMNLKNGPGSPFQQTRSPLGQQDISPAISNMVEPSATYRESGQRWMEKQEARSLREALEDMDLRDEERLYEAAKEQASELVWKHRNPHVPYRNPNTPYDYKSHLRKGSRARSLLSGHHGDVAFQHESRIPTRIPSSDKPLPTDTEAADVTKKPPPPTQASTNATGGNDGHALWDSPQKRAYMSMTTPINRSNMSGRRRFSGSKSRKTSGGLFRNPNDQIYEEPGEPTIEAETVIDKSPGPLQVKPRNVIPNIQSAGQPPSRSTAGSASLRDKLSRFDIYKNPPSQSRNPSYVKNDILPIAAGSMGSSGKEILPDGPARKDGIEIRGDDIRAATSMRMRDRSPKLPSPTVVSDQRGRPIVSFDPHWKPRDNEAGQDRDTAASDGVHEPYHPRLAASAPAIPTINLPEPLPLDQNGDSINSGELTRTTNFFVPDIPSISVEDAQITTHSVPTPDSTGWSKPIPRKVHESSTARDNLSTRHWSQSPSIRRATAQCYTCALPISGRIVSAASQRFHPQCFTCHHCSTLLEHVAFYPEPEDSRKARLARIQARATAVDPGEVIEGKTAEDDGDDGLRFYCHLDFHEEFSPRCRNCKTPIEGEVVVACGGEWHVGHFFCAECGDPFDAKTPFVEREGYAWCVECHTKRFSGKCKGCKKPIVDLVVRALGGEWHEGCFCCKVCNVSVSSLRTLKDEEAYIGSG